MTLATQMWATLTVVVFVLMIVTIMCGEGFIDRVLKWLFLLWVLVSALICLWAVWS